MNKITFPAYENNIRQLARAALTPSGAMALRMLKTYALAAGVTQHGGGWLRLPGQTVADSHGWQLFATDLLAYGHFGRWGDLVRMMAMALAEAEDAMRVPPEPSSLPPEPPSLPRDADAILGELRVMIEKAQTPTPPPPAEGSVVIGPDDDLVDLLHSDNKIVGKIVMRAAYDALKAMLDVLDGWIEGASSNCEAMNHTSHDEVTCGKTFAQTDIRRMVNDAARLVGTRMPYAEPSS